MTINEKIKVEYGRWHRAKLFRGVVFSFPEPVGLRGSTESKFMWGAATPYWRQKLCLFFSI
jgi:hypothetical protein